MSDYSMNVTDTEFVILVGVLLLILYFLNKEEQ